MVEGQRDSCHDFPATDNNHTTISHYIKAKKTKQTILLLIDKFIDAVNHAGCWKNASRTKCL